ncbi:hypothetical protein BDV38DRAFT_288382 [Aspergillus pseudotamarii]|uniref:Uncharacterized protein n=1 Tax=Aspergillus pseudotamarii TaxID=132259 RepID=A0A5N6SAR5_ASPPS|nr:uncharacterized protein BDV38DRAFT_288382 [Aspergillus pseudotamarii]KAE8131802.1 hypothetical protein BDV38DRAFT_288382 [Aspergillus pseudotamarii]
MDDSTMPSPAQLALAIAIVKHKPADLDIREYILRIRQHIKDTREAEKPYTHDKDRFFDSVSFWRQAYEKSEAEQSKLLDRIYDLERHNGALSSKLHSQNTPLEAEQSSSKRKATVSEKAARGATTRKRAKTQTVNDAPAPWDELDRLDLTEESTGPFMRHYYTLQKALQRRSNALEIVKAAVNLCKTTANELSEVVSEKRAAPSASRNKGSTRTEGPTTAEVFRCIECAFQLLLQVIKTLSGTENGMQSSNRVIYHIIHLYESAMNALEQWCTAKSEQTQPAKQKRAASIKKINDKQLPGSNMNTDHEVSTQMVRLLNVMASSLNPGCAGHQDLLEGFLFILLSRVGKLLCLFVFQDLKLRPDLRADFAKLPLPRGLTELDINDRSLCSAQVEAKCLVWLLKRALAILQVFTSSSSSASRDSDESISFAATLKERLQCTLLQAVFGTDSTWGSSLERPALTDEDLHNLQLPSQSPDQSVPDWFTQEVWKLLGWEILVKSNTSEL